MRIASVLVVGVVAASYGAVTTPAYAAKCVRASAQATMLTTPVATQVAKWSLASSLSSKGLKGKGKVGVKCKYEFVLSTCTATQRACK